MITVRFHEEAEDNLLKFAVILSRFNGKWVLCKHRERDTYEIPGGHREENETILEAAKRELTEETGATDFKIESVCIYSVTGKTRVSESGEENFGMLYYAEIKDFDKELCHEIKEIRFFDKLPDNLTYPLIQPVLMKEYERRKKYCNLNL